jgi:hypothetical protein
MALPLGHLAWYVLAKLFPNGNIMIICGHPCLRHESVYWEQADISWDFSAAGISITIRNFPLQRRAWGTQHCMQQWSNPQRMVKQFSTLPSQTLHILMTEQWAHSLTAQVRVQYTQDSSVGIATGYGPEGRGSITGRSNILFSAQRSGWLWDPPSFLSNGYLMLFPRRNSGRSANLITHLHLVQKSRIKKLYLHSPTRLHSVMLD